MLKTMSRRPSLPEASESLRRRRRLLLLSNSRNQGQGYLEHTQDQIRDLLGERINTALFIPFASVIVSYDEFTANVREGFSKMRCQVHSLHQAADPKRAIAEAEAIVVGGGNTFQLLNTLYEKDLLGSIQERVGAGVPYIGWSAGANIACPTIKSTNDMPIVEPTSLNALNLVPFQINSHFIDFPLPGEPAETRVDRLMEFVAVNPGVYVVGMRDGTMLRVVGTSIKLEGTGRACVFVKDKDPTDYGPADSLQFLLGDEDAELVLADGTQYVPADAGQNPRRPRKSA
jgi:dipeptidase E